MKFVSILLVLFLALVGCREVITEPNPDPNPSPNPSTGDPSTPPESAPSIFLKGPTDMREGDTDHFRGQHFYDTDYSWQWFSPDGGAVKSEDPQSARVFDLTATQSGTITVTVTARDVETNKVRGVGQLTFPVCQRGVTECTADDNGD